MGLLWAGTVLGEHLRAAAPPRILVGLVCVGLVLARRRWSSVCAAAVVMGVVGGSAAWHGTLRPVEGDCGGVMTLVTDPAALGSGVVARVKVDGLRYEAVAHGAPAWRLARRLAGESVIFSGRCAEMSGPRSRSARVAHVVGRLVPTSVSEEFSEGSMVVRASNRVRRAIVRGVRSMAPDMRALFAGLVIGDDRDQTRTMVAQFRRSGLSHLCAVSGQNVVFLLAVVSPLLRRRRPPTRWLLTMGILAWFTMLTRAEPSVLRASVMAAIVATTSLVGPRINGRHVLSLTVAVLLVVDPMLAWSVGFGLSVGATAGLAWMSSVLDGAIGSAHARGPGRAIRSTVSATLAAQLGTVPVAFMVFGGSPVVSLIANPLVIAVAGGVMMFGLPVALASSLVPTVEPLVSAAMSVPVGWIAFVARVGAAAGPTGVSNMVCWAFVGAFLLVRIRRGGTSTKAGG